MVFVYVGILHFMQNLTCEMVCSKTCADVLYAWLVATFCLTLGCLVGFGCIWVFWDRIIFKYFYCIQHSCFQLRL